MRAGDLDKRITIEQPSTVDGAYGPQPGPWVPLVGTGSPLVATKFSAQVQDALPSRSDAVQQGLAVARNQSRCRIRYRSDVTSAMRVTVHWDSGDVTYQIVGGPATIGRKEWTELVLERYSSGG